MAKAIKVKVAPRTGDPAKGGTEESMFISNRGPIDQSFDIRDRLAELVGSGNVLTPDNKAAIYGGLVASLGKEKASKIMNHAYIFNQRPDVQKLPVEEKLRAFYTIGSNDPDVSQIITKSKSLGYGSVPGFRESSSALNQQITGRVAPVEVTEVSPEIKKRVMVRVSK